MIAVDTNVLLRLLIEDDPRQTLAARELLESIFAEDEGCFVSDPVLCEIEWVLDSCYKASRARIVEALQELVANPHFIFVDRSAIRRALDAYRAGRADFSDYLVGSRARAQGARATYTFDRALRGDEGFVILEARRKPESS